MADGQFSMNFTVAPDVPYAPSIPGGTTLMPVDNFGGGSSSAFPIILGGGAPSLIGYVLGNSAVAIALFKVLAATGLEDFVLAEKMKDAGTRDKVANLLTTSDFDRNASFAIPDDLDPSAVPERLHMLADAYARVIDNHNRQLKESQKNVSAKPVKGVLAFITGGTYGVRPFWSDTGTDKPTLAMLAFGPETALDSWDGSKFTANVSEQGVYPVKMVGVSACSHGVANANNAAEGTF